MAIARLLTIGGEKEIHPYIRPGLCTIILGRDPTLLSLLFSRNFGLYPDPRRLNSLEQVDQKLLPRARERIRRRRMRICLSKTSSWRQWYLEHTILPFIVYSNSIPVLSYVGWSLFALGLGMTILSACQVWSLEN